MKNSTPTMFNHVPEGRFQENVESLRHFNSRNAADVEIQNQTWLWDGYIPNKTSTLFAGAGGIGKSTLLLYLASLVTTGNLFKINGTDYQFPQGSVLLFSAEDSVDSNIVPRLEAVGADLSKIEIIESTTDTESKELIRFVELDNDMHLLKAKIKEIGDVRLVIFDPISAYIGNLRDDKASQVRNFILRLNKIAEECNCAFILNTHTRKKSTKGDSMGSAADEVIGSSAWTSTVRQAFSITKHHDDESVIIFVNSKSNCGPKPDALSYKIEQTEINREGLIIPISRINWQPGKIDITADEAVHKAIYEDKSKTQQVKEFLFRKLSDDFGKSLPSKDLVNECINTFDVSERLVHKVKMLLKIGTSGSTRGGTCWFLTPDSPENI